MNKLFARTTVLAFLACITQNVAAITVLDVWRARGVEALARIAAIKKQKQTPEMKCELLKEYSFAMFADPDTSSKLLSQTTEFNVITYFQLSSDQKPKTEIALLYRNSELTPSAVDVIDVGPHGHVIIGNTNKHDISLMLDECETTGTIDAPTLWAAKLPSPSLKLIGKTK
jgi:hypothetical protein